MPRDWQEAVAVNLTACWRLIRTCDPPLRAAPAGRAVVLTDALATAPAAYWGLYGFGKAGQQHLALSWAAEVARTPLRVNLADPGPVATQLRGTAMPGEDPASLRQPGEVAPGIAALCLPGETRHGAVVRV
jgi:NAD(P)-dependent dehydrogenase (short-subunit alcohol dehydrogenase family)